MVYLEDKEGVQAPLKCTSCRLPVSKETYEKAKTQVLVQCEHCNNVMSKGFVNEVNVDFHNEICLSYDDVLIKSCCNCKVNSPVKVNSNWICPTCSTVNME